MRTALYVLDMEEQKSNVTLRILALVVGVLFLGMSLFMVVIGDFDLWTGFILGPLFIYYSAAGNKGLLKIRWLSRYGKKFGK